MRLFCGVGTFLHLWLWFEVLGCGVEDDQHGCHELLFQVFWHHYYTWAELPGMDELRAVELQVNTPDNFG